MEREIKTVYMRTVVAYETKEEAWEAYHAWVEQILPKLLPYRYWRSIPDLEEYRGFDTKKSKFRVNCRITSTNSPFTGVKEATFLPPFEPAVRRTYDNELFCGFGLAPEEKQS